MNKPDISYISLSLQKYNAIYECSNGSDSRIKLVVKREKDPIVRIKKTNLDQLKNNAIIFAGKGICGGKPKGYFEKYIADRENEIVKHITEIHKAAKIINLLMSDITSVEDYINANLCGQKEDM